MAMWHTQDMAFTNLKSTIIYLIVQDSSLINHLQKESAYSVSTGQWEIIIQYILLKQDYKIYNWHSNKNADGSVNRFASNMVILNQAHRVAWLIGQEKILK